jgi:hypothetical protein
MAARFSCLILASLRFNCKATCGLDVGRIFLDRLILVDTREGAVSRFHLFTSLNPFGMSAIVQRTNPQIRR